MHFSVVVITERTQIAPERGDPETGAALVAWISPEVTSLLEQYSEEYEVEGHEEECYCLGDVARQEVLAQIVAELGECPESGQEGWQAYSDARRARETVLLESRTDRNSPDPECEECSGTGIYMSTCNPDGHWDWWQVGGRWSGVLTGYDPEKDPRNHEPCRWCNATGKRRDMEVENGCNGCSGTGTALKWPTQWVDTSENVVIAGSVDWDSGHRIPHAIVTPSGDWIEGPSWGADQASKEAWKEEAKALLAKYAEHIVVMVDCHN